MSDSNLARYQADHLFLLVGENSLPNYVAARLLRFSETKLHLIHSTSTSSVTDRLKAALGGAIETISLTDKQADGFYIYRKIQDHLKALHKRGDLNGSIGLHYTGGTKAMAVHAYRSLLDWQKKRTGSQSVIFSYLDPYQLKLCIDNHLSQSVQEISVSTAINPPPDLETILLLHGLEQKLKPDSEPILADAAKELVFLDERDRNNFRFWSFQNLGKEDAPIRKPRKAKRTIEDNWKNESELKNYDLEISTLPNSIKRLFHKYLDVSHDTLQLGNTSAKAEMTCSELCDWLSGQWLEHAVMSLVLELVDDYGLHDVARSLKIKDPNTKRVDHQFEFDVVFLHGYQLFGISCTTSKDNPTCKLKLFEAYSRAQQLGGDEVRIALICTHENPDRLQKELNLVRDDPKVLVVGNDGLHQLKAKLEDWICLTSKIPKKR
jgi:hypothetical protein